MLGTLLKIFMPYKSPKRMAPILGVVFILAFGIGVFWSVQILLSNYVNSLIRKAVETKEEYAIIKNPDKKYMSLDEEEADFFGESASNISDRIKISQSSFETIRKRLTSIPGIVCQPVVKVPNLTIVSNGDNVLQYQCCLIGCDILDGGSVLPILDTVSDEVKEAFSLPTKNIIPALISKDLFLNAQRGQCYQFSVGGKTYSFMVIDFLNQNKLFSFPTMIVPARHALSLANSEKYDAIAIRSLSKRDHAILQKEISAAAGEGFIVKHWSELLEPLHNLFRSFNVIISSIVSSLFVISFFFLLATYDLILKKHKRHLAVLLALGLSPKVIRKALLLLAVLLSVAGCIVGGGIAFAILKLLPYSSLKPVLSAMFIDDLSFSWNWGIVLMIFITSLVITMGSAWFAAQRIKKIDPIEDLRK